MEQPVWLTRFITCYENLGTQDFSLLKDVYHKNVRFSDPLHAISGIDALLDYFNHLYTNVPQCRFTITSTSVAKDTAFIEWQMEFVHNKLNKGRPILVEGVSKLTAQDDKVILHRDYLDLGSMLYEHIPLLGSAIKHVKKSAAKV